VVEKLVRNSLEHLEAHLDFAYTFVVVVVVVAAYYSNWACTKLEWYFDNCNWEWVMSN
jgi:hypothetical protein